MMKMGPSTSLFLPIILSIFFPIFISADYTNLVFKGCADQNFPDSNGVYKQTLKILLNTLASQSSTAKFYKSASGDGASAINGLYQCRGDLSNDDCNNCVKRAALMSHNLCGQALAVRVHLTGCYLKYEISGFRATSSSEFLYKVCGSTGSSGAGFGDRLETALGEVVKGVGSGNSGGFYAGGYESVYALGQCEGDLGSGDCVNCVKTAIDRAGTECGSAISAQVYLQQCYISYTYYPDGIPRNQNSVQSSGNGVDPFGLCTPASAGLSKLIFGGERGRNAQKTVAIVLGGLVGVGLLLACLLFTKSVFKKKTYTYKYGG